MTLCITFDDGLKTHAHIVAEQLEMRGWKGLFNVITDTLSGLELSRSKLDDLCVRNNSCFMNWNEARELLRRGHEIYPHSCSHDDLVSLESSGKIVELRHEILDSIDAVKRELGVDVNFYCLPHNATSSGINAILKECRVVSVNRSRANFGSNSPSGTKWSLCGYVEESFYMGRTHLDIMVHGIEEAEGGWLPFCSSREFLLFLDEIKECENKGYIRVVPYSEAHPKYGSLLRSACLTVAYKFRRVVYKVIFKRKPLLGRR